MEKRLYRDTRNKMIGGVGSGLAEYFDIDPVLIRLVFVLLTIYHGVGILAYVILWIVVPAKFEPILATGPTADADPDMLRQDAEVERKPKEPGKGSLYGGVILIVIGTLFLLENFLPGFGFEDFWPMLLVAIGGAMLWNSWPDRNDNEEVLS